MIPQLGAQPTVGTSPQSAYETASARSANAGETGRASRASGIETARAVEPPAPANTASSVATPERRNLNPPDPNAPAGPPPAFEASILDRQREELMRPREPDLRPAGERPAETQTYVAPVTAKPVAEETRSAPQDAEPLPVLSAPVVGDDAVEEAPATGSKEADATAPRAAATPDTPEPEPAREPETTRRPYDVPPSAEQRAEREVATIRRIETPYDTATVDVSR